MWLFAIVYVVNFSQAYWKKINKDESIMSEEFNGGMQRKIKVKDMVRLCIAFAPIALFAIGFASIMLLIGATIKGAIVSVCWNIAITTMFGVHKITLFQAFVLVFTIGCLKTDYISEVKFEYAKIKEKIFERCQKKKMTKIVKKKIVKVVPVILIVIFSVISIFITIWITMYSWNNILPQLLNVELVKINLGQAFCFAYIFNLIFGISKSDDKKSKKNKENKEDFEKKENTDETTIISEDKPIDE